MSWSGNQLELDGALWWIVDGLIQCSGRLALVTAMFTSLPQERGAISGAGDLRSGRWHGRETVPQHAATEPQRVLIFVIKQPPSFDANFSLRCLDHVHRFATGAIEIPIIAVALIWLGRSFLGGSLHDGRVAFSARLTFLGHFRIHARRFRRITLPFFGALIPGVLQEVALIKCGLRQSVTSFVVFDASVAPHPFEFDIVFVEGRRQTLPKVMVLCTLGSRGIHRPTVRTPFKSRPTRDRFHDVFGITVENNLTRLFQSFEGSDHCHEFHAIVRRVEIAAREFFAMLPEAKHNPVAASARIGLRASIGENRDLFRRLACVRGIHCIGHDLTHFDPVVARSPDRVTDSTEGLLV